MAVHVETLLDGKGRPESTRLVLALDPTVDVREPPALPAELRDAARGATPEAASRPPRLDVQPDAMIIEVPGFAPDPGALRPIVAEMQRLAARLRGETSRGPYR